MVAFSTLFLGFTAIATSLAAPAAEPQPQPAQVVERGELDFVLGEDHPLVQARAIAANLSARAQAADYVQNYQTGGTVNFKASGNSYTLDFNTQKDFVVGVGWKTGNANPITYKGTFTVSQGLGTLSVYGWTTNPLVEYYVMEDHINYSQTGTKKGTVTTDGGTYDIWEHQQVNQPSIVGTSTFNQYLSIRQQGRASGTVTMQNHFDAWQKQGMNLGTQNFQVVSVESFNNGVGSAQQTVSK